MNRQVLNSNLRDKLFSYNLFVLDVNIMAYVKPQKMVHVNVLEFDVSK